MTTSRKILVTGATGKQGGAVAHRLLERGHTVRAMTRKPDGAAAQALAARGVELVTGALEDRASLDRALAGVDAVFAMTTPFEAGPAVETAQGLTIADAATAAGVHLVFTSVANADRATGIPHFDSKFVVEQHITAIGARATVIAPAYFMENIGFARAQMREGVYPLPLTPTRKLAQVALADIAAVAVAVLEQPERHVGKRYDIAGDELTAEEQIAIMARASGHAFHFFQVPMEMIRGAMGDDGVLMYEWFESTGYTIDRAALAAALPEVTWTSFEAWARGFDWAAFLAA